jgi:hypothetical protein
MADTQLLSDASSYFTEGCDSYSAPDSLGRSEYVAAMNCVNRGGVVQTRPGSLARLLIGGTNLQGCSGFTPSSGVPHIVYAVDGLVYVSPAPFREVRRLPNIKFSPNSKHVVFESCLKSTDFAADGTLVALDRPYQVLIMQDGVTRAAFWDGGTSRHLNPSPSNQTATVPGLDETFIGLWMKWSGNRLWVARGPMLFASDAGNPTKFTETQYLNEARAFYLPGDCTGIVETPDHLGIIVFTELQATYFQSSIQDRTTWLSTPSFQAPCFNNVGCVAPLSITVQYGLIWWMSAVGLMNSDQALNLNRTSRIDLQDNEMMCSKANLGPNLSRVCSVSHENYLLISVPSGSRLNRHTWCLDQDVLENNQNSWASYWTGWRPVQWMKLMVDSEERVFFASLDEDGCNRIWEAFQRDHTDNGQNIPCFVQLRDHDFSRPASASDGGISPLSMKRFHFARIHAKEILGNVSLMVAASSTRGGWTKICTKEIVATKGGINFDSLYDKTTCMNGNRPQSRLIKTQADVPLTDCSQGGVESPYPNNVDRAFSILVMWSGRMGISGVDLVASLDDDRISGICEPDETTDRCVSENGCSALDKVSYGCPFEKFSSTKTVALECSRTGAKISSTASWDSFISQADADRMATGYASVLSRQVCDCSAVVTPSAPSEPSNSAPVVTVPDERTHYIFNDNVTGEFVGTVTDDGNVDGQLSNEWTMVSGPAPVAFSDPHTPDVFVTFFKTGDYVLRLAAFDGDLYSSADITVHILDAVSVPGTYGPLVMHGGVASQVLSGFAPYANLIKWAFVSGPAVATFVDDTDIGTQVNFTAPGEYEISLTASDPRGDSLTVRTQITVLFAPTINISATDYNNIVVSSDPSGIIFDFSSEGSEFSGSPFVAGSVVQFTFNIYDGVFDSITCDTPFTGPVIEGPLYIITVTIGSDPVNMVILTHAP